MMKADSTASGGKSETDADPGQARVPDDKPKIEDEEEDGYQYDDPNAGLLGRKPAVRSSPAAAAKSSHFDPISSSWGDQNPRDWQRPYWLGGSLCLILFAFWMLDSLKDPIFGDLVNGNLKRHQPIAKLVSVATTMALVLFLEFLSNARKERQRRYESQLRESNESILEGGGTWTKMGFRDDEEPPEIQNSHAESASLVHILVTYAIVFALISKILQYHHKETVKEGDEGLTPWHFVGYFVYATIESFGSLAVASFWSFTNTTLSLEDAQKFYGTIVAIAQLGAVGGSTMATIRRFNDTTLLLLSCLTILLHLVVMALYTRRFRPTNIQAIVANNEELSEVVEPFAAKDDRRQSTVQSLISGAASTSNDESNALWSGVHLILRHNYVLLLLCVSCLYEVSLTCMDYQMKLIGYKRFENIDSDAQGLTFTGFMGHFGQLVNITSLVLSLFGFPFMIARFGLRYTLRLFPTLLVIATVVAFTALPGNLAVLFFSMSLLKAMTYSIHDPSKELLYLPTSNTIKYKAKFWIDIVGARVAKAIGSTINTYAGSVDRSVSIGSFPSLFTAVLLWVACYCAGNDFDHLVETGTIVGVGDDSDVPPKRFTAIGTADDDIHSGIYFDDGGAEDSRGGDHEDEADFVSNGPEKAAADSSIELNELKSAIRSKEPRIRAV